MAFPAALGFGALPFLSSRGFAFPFFRGHVCVSIVLLSFHSGQFYFLVHLFSGSRPDFFEGAFLCRLTVLGPLTLVVCPVGSSDVQHDLPIPCYSPAPICPAFLFSPANPLAFYTLWTLTAMLSPLFVFLLPLPFPKVGKGWTSIRAQRSQRVLAFFFPPSTPAAPCTIFPLFSPLAQFDGRTLQLTYTKTGPCGWVVFFPSNWKAVMLSPLPPPCDETFPFRGPLKTDFSPTVFSVRAPQKLSDRLSPRGPQVSDPH